MTAHRSNVNEWAIYSGQTSDGTPAVVFVFDGPEMLTTTIAVHVPDAERMRDAIADAIAQAGRE